MALITIPDFTLKRIQQAMSDLVSPNVFGTQCEMFYPPIESGCPNCLPDPIGRKSSNIYLNGGPAPFSAGQVCVYCNGLYYLAVEFSEKIYMTINWQPSQFDPTFPKGFRYADGNILTRGFTKDMQKVMNADFMEIHQNTGFAHYRFKLIGEPALASQTLDGVFFWAWWNRA